MTQPNVTSTPRETVLEHIEVSLSKSLAPTRATAARSRHA